MSEEYVTEYEIDAQETLQGYANPDFGKINILTGRPKEKVVRCRDCASWRISRGDGHAFCEQTGQRCDGDGFCAWARPKEDA